MEKILQHSMVKQGLIIAYYFSNRWYRKCLFNESSIPVSNNTDLVKVAEPDLGYTHQQKKADLTCASSTEEREQQSKDKSEQNEPVKNPAISND